MSRSLAVGSCSPSPGGLGLAGTMTTRRRSVVVHGVLARVDDDLHERDLDDDLHERDLDDPGGRADDDLCSGHQRRASCDCDEVAAWGTRAHDAAPMLPKDLYLVRVGQHEALDRGLRRERRARRARGRRLLSPTSTAR